MECDICLRPMPEIEDAIEKGWYPYFWAGDREYGPVCPACVEKYITIDETGDYVIKV